jgi:hypothetical protein
MGILLTILSNIIVICQFDTLNLLPCFKTHWLLLHFIKDILLPHSLLQGLPDLDIPLYQLLQRLVLLLQTLALRKLVVDDSLHHLVRIHLLLVHPLL